MTTTIQIRAEIETAKRFKKLWERLKKSNKDISQGDTLEKAIQALELNLRQGES